MFCTVMCDATAPAPAQVLSNATCKEKPNCRATHWPGITCFVLQMVQNQHMLAFAVAPLLHLTVL